ncbi:hypothetical protein CACET_c26940 [Clostridium aceticum]|uniref:Uncharacterized protein n=1 Tax=Clostridium aceticum TaxID=84022 RepID=A0A0D8I941_9CLOT|nr:hypothetical protein [Clostridium aceticum]AKL96139.1 hypothetical protein CACET_c26940 [Clostridium aceticum]KJF26564.1 hypothetical protein TZ02_11845 [Clostridium aceticum]
MKKNKWMITLYLNAVKWRLISYIIAFLVIFIPIFIVAVTDNGFSSFYGKTFIALAFIFIIIGKVLTTLKKTIDDGAMHWTGIGSIIGLLIVLLWDVLR